MHAAARPRRRPAFLTSLGAAVLMLLWVLGAGSQAIAGARAPALAVLSTGADTALVVVPAALTGDPLDAAAFTVAVDGQQVPAPSVERLLDAGGEPTLLVLPAADDGGATVAAAVELVRRLRQTAVPVLLTPQGPVGGSAREVLQALSKTPAAPAPDQDILDALTGVAGAGGLVVVVADCAAVRAASGVGASTSEQALVLGIGGCLAEASRLAGPSGLGVAVDGPPDQVAAGADLLADRLLGLYRVDLPAGWRAGAQISVALRGVTASASLGSPPASGQPPQAGDAPTGSAPPANLTLLALTLLALAFVLPVLGISGALLFVPRYQHLGGRPGRVRPARQ